tara:strand:- start:109 stop:417 length:309 start_codon:yes stop_codon:yes gene_type:complete
MNDIFINGEYDPFEHIKNKMRDLKREKENAEKKVLDYEMDLYNKNEELKMIKKENERLRLDLRKEQLKNYELTLNIKELNINKKNQPNLYKKDQSFTYITDR